MKKTHTCGELRIDHVGASVRLAGWVHRRRDHGGLTFIDLRDRFGIVQIVTNPNVSKDAHETMVPVRNEWVLMLDGIVRPRPKGMVNPNIKTGEIEVEISSLAILNQAKTPPFYINKDEEIDEHTRLKYRYLDLRRERMRNNLVLRHKVVKFIRDFLDLHGFLEVETPILFKSTPEGARDYLVPSRVHPGEFYALPQSPQQLKQLLMVAGIEKYFQIARCFRDEDQRGDRQPEFTQLDLEMSFVNREDVMSLAEELFTKLVAKVVPHKRIQETPWPRFTYQDALSRFGKDNPDIRFGMELEDVTNLVKNSGFKVFDQVTSSGGIICGFKAEGMGNYSRKQIDELSDFTKRFGTKGLAYIALTSVGERRSNFVKFLSNDVEEKLINRFDAKPGDLLVFTADKPITVYENMGRLRELLGDRLGLRDDDVLGFCWVIDFPLVMWNEDENRWDPSHHLFTSPVLEDLDLLESNPGDVRGQQYDMILNGNEVGGGSIRIHERDLQAKIFKLIGLDMKEANERFGHMLEAFEYGTPPHGGIAPGIDRICMILAGEPNIREVIAFPKNQMARDVMGDAPSPVNDRQLRELKIKLDLGNTK
jgi:aspartyl-tRNA synthetase